MRKAILFLAIAISFCLFLSGCLYVSESSDDGYDGLYLKDCGVDVILDYLETTTEYTYYTNEDMFRIYILGLNEGYTKGVEGIEDAIINEFVYDEEYQELLEEYGSLIEW